MQSLLEILVGRPGAGKIKKTGESCIRVGFAPGDPSLFLDLKFLEKGHPVFSIMVPLLGSLKMS